MKLTPEQEGVESRMSMLWAEDWAPLFALLTSENIDHCDRIGRTILSQAICSLPVTTEKIRRLIELGADVNATEKIGFTPLHFAAQEKKPEIAQLLVDHGANVNAQDKHGNTPLGRATFQRDMEIVGILMKGGADPHIKNFSDVSAMDLAHTMQNTDLIKLFESSVA